MGKSAEDTLAHMRRSKHGWGPDDVRRVLVGFGFEWREGRKHTVYWHPEREDVAPLTVPRHNTLRAWVADETIKRVDALREQGSEKNPGDERTGPHAE